MSNLPKVIEPVGFGDLRKVVVDVGGASPNNVESAQHKPELCPTRDREVVNPSGLVEQRVSSTVWKIVGVASNRKQIDDFGNTYIFHLETICQLAKVDAKKVTKYNFVSHLVSSNLYGG